MLYAGAQRRNTSPMQVALIAPVSVGIVRWMASEPQISVFVKVAYRLTPPHAKPLRLPPAFEQTEDGWNDFVPGRSTVNVLLRGVAHAPNPAKVIPVRFRVGALDRTVYAHSPRAARKIRLEGNLRVRSEDGSASTRVGPGPAPGAWRDRRLTPGDFRIFDAAPAAQRIARIPVGASIQLEGLSATPTRLSSELPDSAPCLFILSGADDIRRLPLSCDTLVIDAEASECVLTYRTILPAASVADARFVVGVESADAPLEATTMSGRLQSAVWHPAVESDHGSSGRAPSTLDRLDTMSQTRPIDSSVAPVDLPFGGEPQATERTLATTARTQEMAVVTPSSMSQTQDVEAIVAQLATPFEKRPRAPAKTMDLSPRFAARAMPFIKGGEPQIPAPMSSEDADAAIDRLSDTSEVDGQLASEPPTPFDHRTRPPSTTAPTQPMNVVVPPMAPQPRIAMPPVPHAERGGVPPAGHAMPDTLPSARRAEAATPATLSLETYAAIRVDLQDDDVSLEEVLRRHGVDEVMWRRTDRDLTIRLAEDASSDHPRLLTELEREMQKRRAERIADEPADADDEASLAIYAQIQVELEDADDPQVVLQEMGLNADEWKRMRRMWNRRCLSDPKLAAALRDALMRARRITAS